ncbi:helix-turn-helix transcriptional regulator [Paenibacillus fonticola]|uniref:helix-turn-helix transcriptional regulator n=1 Tax=Paenibacillus fonticola TaxID=379896 RepID=UPI00037B986C|nr:AraC family transcriptional regulator [Paenibacillus fonticola]
MSILTSQQLNYICKLMWQSFKIPLFVFNDKREIELEFSANFVLNPLYSSKLSWLNQIYDLKAAQRFPALYRTDYLETIISVPIPSAADRADSVIMLGPSTDSELSEGMIQSLLSDLQIPSDRQAGLFSYYASLPVLSIINNVYAAMHLHYMLYQEELDPAQIYALSHSLTRQPVSIEAPSLTISENRQNTAMHHDALFEKKTMQAIREGNKAEVVRHWRHLPSSGQVGLLAKTSQLRNKKNLAITVITLATRAAVEGGLQYETALTISDLYIQSVEEIKDSKAVDSFIEEMLADFAERVHQTKRNRYSKPINICLDYIFKHLYDKISLADLAQKAALHPHYLSGLFKKEVGCSLRDYIQQTKIEEARSLLMLTDQPISEISTLLNYHDQSYFSKIFKKFTGITPNEFRNSRGVYSVCSIHENEK